jgi:hypothetical protein
MGSKESHFHISIKEGEVDGNVATGSQCPDALVQFLSVMSNDRCSIFILSK